jgi:rhomboid family GlyGly-CTERM serine protease
MSALACLIYWTPADRWLIYDRTAIFEGEVWRCWTGHVTHFTTSHLLWNLAIFVPTGWWLESAWPRQARWYYAIAPFIISGLLLAFDPALARYAGLSGVATGVLVLLAGLQLAKPARTEPWWIWVGVLAMVAFKVGYELLTEAPLLVSGLENVRTMPMAHLGGAGSGALVWVLFFWRGKTGA